MPPRGASRKRIIEAARQEIAEHGFTGARLARIAKRAGLNKQLIFYYFGSKQGLFEHLASDAEAARPHSEAKAHRGPGQFREALRAVYETLREHPEITALLIEPARPNPSDPEQRRLLERLISPVREVIAYGQGLGHYRDDLDPDFAAIQVISLVVGHIALAAGEAPDDADAWTAATAELLQRGLAW